MIQPVARTAVAFPASAAPPLALNTSSTTASSGSATKSPETRTLMVFEVSPAAKVTLRALDGK